MSEYIVCAMYKFVTLEDFKEMKVPLLNVMENNSVRGTLLLAKEGINGTIAGTQAGVDAVLAFLKADTRLAEIMHKESYDDHIPFNRTKVKLKKEIVTLGIEGLDPLQASGTYVKPKDWNALISDPEVLVIDTRNDYEIAIGAFKNAINPHTENFREFPAYVEKHLNKIKHKKIMNLLI